MHTLYRIRCLVVIPVSDAINIALNILHKIDFNTSVVVSVILIK